MTNDELGGYAVGAQEFKDNKDLNDIKDAPKRLSFKSPLVSSVTLSLHTRLSRLLFQRNKRRDCIPHPASALRPPPARQAQSRHRGARSAMASAMRDLCKIAELAVSTLAVLRRSRPFRGSPILAGLFRFFRGFKIILSIIFGILSVAT